MQWNFAASSVSSNCNIKQAVWYLKTGVEQTSEAKTRRLLLILNNFLTAKYILWPRTLQMVKYNVTQFFMEKRWKVTSIFGLLGPQNRTAQWVKNVLFEQLQIWDRKNKCHCPWASSTAIWGRKKWHDGKRVLVKWWTIYSTSKLWNCQGNGKSCEFLLQTVQKSVFSTFFGIKKFIRCPSSLESSVCISRW